MAMLEGLVTIRSTGALVEAVLERKVNMRMHSDSTAAIAIAAGTTSSWRTRHLRIRAAGLTEALRSREVSLRHVAGVELVADGMTKQLTGQPLKNFKETLGLEKVQVIEKMEIKRLEMGRKIPDPRFARGRQRMVDSCAPHRSDSDHRGHIVPGWNCGSQKMDVTQGGAQGETPSPGSTSTSPWLRAGSWFGPSFGHRNHGSLRR